MNQQKVDNFNAWKARFQDNSVRFNLELVRQSVVGVGQGIHENIVISGPAGIGKNHLVMDALRSIGQKYYLSTPMSDTAIKRDIFEHANCILLFDDADGIWRADTVGTWKKANDPDRRNRVLVHTLADPMKAINFGRPFQDTTRKIYLTNKDVHNKNHFPPAVRVHVAAITSRLMIYTIPFNLNAIWEYTCGLVLREGMLRQYKVDVVNEALVYLTNTASLTQDASPRRIQAIAKAIKLHPTSWQSYLNMQLPAHSSGGNASMLQPGEPYPELVVVPSGKAASPIKIVTSQGNVAATVAATPASPKAVKPKALKKTAA